MSNMAKRYFPGIVLCALVMFLGIYGAEVLGLLFKQFKIISPESDTPISGIFVAILIGMIIRNLFGLNDRFVQGVQYSIKYLLRFGIVLLGLRLSLVEALKLGAIGIPLIMACIASGFFLTIYLTQKMNQSSRLGMLIASGTGICGVTAIMATAPVIKAKDDEISYAVANITIFGLTCMILYPLLANLLFQGDVIKTGLFLGTAIHDTAQVTGSALIYAQMFQAEDVINVATVTKLTRNLFIIAIIPMVSYFYFKHRTEEKDTRTNKKWYTFVPLFVIGFLCMSFVRTLGDFTLGNDNLALFLFSTETWESIYTNGSTFGTTYLLGMAMAAVGLSTNFKMFKGIGIKPFYIGLTAAVSVSLVSALLISLFGNWIVI